MITTVTAEEFYWLGTVSRLDPNPPKVEVYMTVPDEEQVRQLAALVGIEINEEEVLEVANRFQSLILELDRLKELDIDGVEPMVIFPDED